MRCARGRTRRRARPPPRSRRDRRSRRVRPVAIVRKLVVTTMIGSLPEIQSISAMRMELMASVAMKEPILALTMSPATTTPIAAPATRVSAKAAGMGRDLSEISQATSTAPMPTSVPSARSMTPAESGTTTATAMMAEIAWLSSKSRHVCTVKKVCGSQIEKTTNITARMYSALTLRNDAAPPEPRPGGRLGRHPLSPPRSRANCPARRCALAAHRCSRGHLDHVGAGVAAMSGGRPPRSARSHSSSPTRCPRSSTSTRSQISASSFVSDELTRTAVPRRAASRTSS